MKRNMFAWCLSSLSSLVVVSSATPPPKVVAERIEGAKPRNVVFILTDDHRYDAMGFMGHLLRPLGH